MLVTTRLLRTISRKLPSKYMIQRSESESIIIQELLPGKIPEMVSQEELVRELRRKHLGRELSHFESVVAKRLNMDENKTRGLIDAVLDIILNPDYKRTDGKKIWEN